MDLEQWIYSPHIARWLSAERALNLTELTDCILSAPHRTLEEKLDGLRKLRKEAEEEPCLEGTERGFLSSRSIGEKAAQGFPGRQGIGEKVPWARSGWALKLLDEKIEMGETLDEILHMAGGLNNLYEADIYCHGKKEESVKKRIFTLPQPGIKFIREQIGEAADRYEIGAESFFGVLRKFRRRGGRYLDLEWNILLNPEGRILYCLPETVEAVEQNDYQIGPCDYHYLKLPYPSGTVVETLPSPFFPEVKGVLVNRREPWEEGFAQDDEQWLVYPDERHGSQDAGIGAIPLDHYASFTFGADFLLPFVQFLIRSEGALSEREKWLYELGELVKKDKSCFALILRDRQPKKCLGLGGKADIRRDYVRELEERCRKGETKRLAEELAKEKQERKSRKEAEIEKRK